MADKKTIADTAAAVAQENAKKRKEEAAAREAEKAQLNPRPNAPLTVMSRKYRLRDPDTGVLLMPGKPVRLPYAGGWMKTQIEADLVEVVDGSVETSPAPVNTDSSTDQGEPSSQSEEAEEAGEAGEAEEAEEAEGESNSIANAFRRRRNK
jgi:hypothetical protein